MLFQRVGARQRIENQRKVLPILLPQNPMPVLPANLRLKESSPRRKPLLRECWGQPPVKKLVSVFHRAGTSDVFVEPTVKWRFASHDSAESRPPWEAFW
jgi:hypothetical protein